MGESMRVGVVASALAVLVLLAGCSGFAEKKKSEYKTKTVQVHPLEVPPDLTAPENDKHYAIPADGGDVVASYSEYSKTRAEQPCVLPASAPAAVEAMPEIKQLERDGVKYVAIGEAFDRAWRRVGLALDRAHIRVSDKDRSKGLFYAVPPQEQDKKSDKADAKQPDYLVTVREKAGTSEVSAADAKGQADADSQRLLDELFANLKQADTPGATPSGATPAENALRPAR